MLYCSNKKNAQLNWRINEKIKNKVNNIIPIGTVLSLYRIESN